MKVLNIVYDFGVNYNLWCFKNQQNLSSGPMR